MYLRNIKRAINSFLSISFLCIIFFISGEVSAQEKWSSSELGLFAGTSYYIGDLNPQIHFKEVFVPALGIFFRRNFNKRYALRFGLNYGELGANDQDIDLPYNKFRGSHFHSTIWDLSASLEFNFFPYSLENTPHENFTPYVYIGPSFFSSSITTNRRVKFGNSAKIEEDYKISGLAINFGLGIKWSITNSINMTLEWGMRKTFTDELDGQIETSDNYFQSYNPDNKDWYNFSGITLSFKLPKKTAKCAAYD